MFDPINDLLASSFSKKGFSFKKNNITETLIRMNNIINEAMIFTMNYILVNIEDTKESGLNVKKDQLPVFKNIILENINCNNASIGLKVNGIKDSPIKDMTIKNSKIIAENSMNVLNCKNIHLENTIIITPEQTFEFLNDVINHSDLE